MEQKVERFEFKLKAESDLGFFRDHFQNDPLVPGVVQLNWAFEKAFHAGLMNKPPEGIAGVKFLAPWRPGEPALLKVWKTSTETTGFEYHLGDRLLSKGMWYSGVADWAKDAGEIKLPNESPQSFPDPIELLPHGPSVVLLSSVLQSSNQASLFRLGWNEGLAYLTDDNPLASVFWIEAASQAVAAHESLATSKNTPIKKKGKLVLVKQAGLAVKGLDPRSDFRVLVAPVFKNNKYGIYHAELFGGSITKRITAELSFAWA